MVPGRVVGIGDVRRMKYFDREMVAWRAASGRVAVMDAYCEHLGAHLGYGGRVEDERIVCPFHGSEWNAEGRNVCIPYENRPNPGRRIHSYPVVERNESIYIWHDVHGRAPHFDVPDVFTGFGDGATAADYYPAYGRSTLHRERLELHPQYVLENGVDFAHFEYVHKVPITPKFTRQDIESVDVSCHHSVASWQMCGYGRPVDDPELPGMLEKGTRVFADGVHLMADCFGLELDDVVFDYELGACTRDVDLGWYKLPKGSLGANYLKYQGVVDGVPKVEVHVEWQTTPHTEPNWNVQGCYITRIKGDPYVSSKHRALPRPDTDFSSPEAFASVGMTVTGLPALNAIRSVVEARPGVITSADLPLRAFAGRFR